MQLLTFPFSKMFLNIQGLNVSTIFIQARSVLLFLYLAE